MNRKSKKRLIIGLVIFLLFELAHFWQTKQDEQIAQIMAENQEKITFYENEIIKRDLEINGYKSLERKYTNSIRKIVKNYYRADSFLNVGGEEINSPAYDDVGAYARILEGGRSFDSVWAATEVFFEQREEYLESIPDIWPIYYSDMNLISSYFGDRISPFGNNLITEHAGIDIMGIYYTPILATADGVVKERWLYHWTYGRFLILEHENGIQTRYAHLAKTVVKAGDEIKKGDVIGYLGNTGISTGPHLHYEIRKNNIPVDPLNYIKGYLTNN